MTPYGADGGVDYKAYETIFEAQRAAGVHGIIIAGSTGEYYAQSMPDRFEIAEFARKVIGNRLPMMVGTGSIRTENSVICAKHAARSGRSRFW